MNYLKGIDVFNKRVQYCAIYSKVEGLNVSNPVIINGLNVGSVREIYLMHDHSGRIFVRFEIHRKGIKLPMTTVAKIASTDLLGSKSIELILGKKEGVYHQAGDTLPSAVEASLTEEVNNQILPLKAKAEELLSSIDTLVGVVHAILNKQARDNLSSSFESIKNALATFEVVALRTDTLIMSEKIKFNQTMTNIQSITNNLRNNNDNITMILDNVAYITDSIAMSDLTSTINNAGKAFADAADVMEKINKGEGTIGQLVNNDSLYNALEASARDLDRLLVDLEENPNRYVHVSVFGRRDKTRKLEEKAKKKAEKEAAKKK